MKKFYSLLVLLTLTSCATTSDPSLASGVKRQGGGIYSISELNLSFTFDTLISQATKQCRLDGNKRLNIMTSTYETGFSGTRYPMLVFRCE